MGSLSKQDRVRALIALATAVVMWGSAFVAIRAAGRFYGPGHLSAARLLIASAVLGAVVVARKGIRLPARRDWPVFILLGFTGQMLYQLLLNAGERSVDAGTASLLVSTAPIIASLLAVGFLGERLSALGWVGTAIAFTGAATIAVGGAGASMHASTGTVMIVAATCVWASFLVIQKTLADRYDSIELTAWPMWIGTAFLLPFTAGLPQAVAAAPLTANLAVVWLGAASSVAGFLAWAYAIQRLDVVVATSALYTVPVAAFAIGLAFLGETPGVWALIGGAIAVGGVALAQLKGRPAATPAEVELAEG